MSSRGPLTVIVWLESGIL